MNPLPPNHMSAAERLGELCSILAVGLIRLKARQSSRQSTRQENRFVDFMPDQCRHATQFTGETHDGYES